ncbi:MAG: UDP-N-acetylmuramate dehydrogenase [Ignavibacteriales bacterium]|nr:UDP-N-acetylmuramate dehydrogenase [Ignavibacteriales bacterium]
MVRLEDIQSFFRGWVAANEPMVRYTSMRVGGAADFYLEPADKDDMVALVKFLDANAVPWMMVGRGSNMLVSDEGIRGAVINAESAISNVSLEGGIVTAEAGVRLNRFVDFCIQHELAGVEMLAGIPGTVGGAVVMNAGAHGGEISDHLVDIEVLRNGSIQWIDKAAAKFSYRRSGLEHDAVLSARFKLTKGNKEKLAHQRRELILKRNQTQPLELPNSGSMFKNPPNTFAAKLIEQAGLKGKRVGRAEISEKHANFIVNLGDAKAADVVRLLELARRTVYQNTGLMLELEVKLVGFSDDVKRKFA